MKGRFELNPIIPFPRTQPGIKPKAHQQQLRPTKRFT